MRVRQHYSDELLALHNELNSFGNFAASAVQRALDALANQNIGLAREVIADDVRANAAQRSLEAHAVALIAMQQPVARDLRSIMAAITVGSELERIADYAKSIARFVIGSEHAQPLKPSAELLRLGNTALKVLQHALVALATLNAEDVNAIDREEEEVDQLYQQVLVSIAEGFTADPEGAPRAADLLFVAHNLERIADRSTNIAERVIYYASGQMVELNP